MFATCNMTVSETGTLEGLRTAKHAVNSTLGAENAGGAYTEIVADARSLLSSALRLLFNLYALLARGLDVGDFATPLSQVVVGMDSKEDVVVFVNAVLDMAGPNSAKKEKRIDRVVGRVVSVVLSMLGDVPLLERLRGWKDEGNVTWGIVKKEVAEGFITNLDNNIKRVSGSESAAFLRSVFTDNTDCGDPDSLWHAIVVEVAIQLLFTEGFGRKKKKKTAKGGAGEEEKKMGGIVDLGILSLGRGGKLYFKSKTQDYVKGCSKSGAYFLLWEVLSRGEIDKETSDKAVAIIRRRVHSRKGSRTKRAKLESALARLSWRADDPRLSDADKLRSVVEDVLRALTRKHREELARVAFADMGFRPSFAFPSIQSTPVVFSLSDAVLDAICALPSPLPMDTGASVTTSPASSTLSNPLHVLQALVADRLPLLVAHATKSVLDGFPGLAAARDATAVGPGTSSRRGSARGGGSSTSVSSAERKKKEEERKARLSKVRVLGAYNDLTTIINPLSYPHPCIAHLGEFRRGIKEHPGLVMAVAAMAGHSVVPSTRLSQTTNRVSILNFRDGLDHSRASFVYASMVTRMALASESSEDHEASLGGARASASRARVENRVKSWVRVGVLKQDQKKAGTLLPKIASAFLDAIVSVSSGTGVLSRVQDPHGVDFGVDQAQLAAAFETFKTSTAGLDLRWLFSQPAYIAGKATGSTLKLLAEHALYAELCGGALVPVLGVGVGGVGAWRRVWWSRNSPQNGVAGRKEGGPSGEASGVVPMVISPLSAPAPPHPLPFTLPSPTPPAAPSAPSAPPPPGPGPGSATGSASSASAVHPTPPPAPAAPSNVRNSNALRLLLDDDDLTLLSKAIKAKKGGVNVLLLGAHTRVAKPAQLRARRSSSALPTRSPQSYVFAGTVVPPRSAGGEWGMVFGRLPLVVFPDLIGKNPLFLAPILPLESVEDVTKHRRVCKAVKDAVRSVAKAWKKDSNDDDDEGVADAVIQAKRKAKEALRDKLKRLQLSDDEVAVIQAFASPGLDGSRAEVGRCKRRVCGETGGGAGTASLSALPYLEEMGAELGARAVDAVRKGRAVYFVTADPGRGAHKLGILRLCLDSDGAPSLVSVYAKDDDLRRAELERYKAALPAASSLPERNAAKLGAKRGRTSSGRGRGHGGRSGERKRLKTLHGSGAGSGGGLGSASSSPSSERWRKKKLRKRQQLLKRSDYVVVGNVTGADVRSATGAATERMRALEAAKAESVARIPRECVEDMIELFQEAVEVWGLRTTLAEHRLARFPVGKMLKQSSTWVRKRAESAGKSHERSKRELGRIESSIAVLIAALSAAYPEGAQPAASVPISVVDGEGVLSSLASILSSPFFGGDAGSLARLELVWRDALRVAYRREDDLVATTGRPGTRSRDRRVDLAVGSLFVKAGIAMYGATAKRSKKRKLVSRHANGVMIIAGLGDWSASPSTSRGKSRRQKAAAAAFIGVDALAASIRRVTAGLDKSVGGSAECVCGLLSEFRTSKIHDTLHLESEVVTSLPGRTRTRLNSYKVRKEQKRLIREHGFDQVLGEALRLEALRRDGVPLEDVRAWRECRDVGVEWIRRRRRSARTTLLLRRYVQHTIRATNRTSTFAVSSIWRLKKVSTHSRVHCGADCEHECARKVKTLLEARNITESPSPAGSPAEQAKDDEVVLFYAQRDVLAVRSLFVRLFAVVFHRKIPFAFRRSKDRPSSGVLDADIAIELLALA